MSARPVKSTIKIEKWTPFIVTKLPKSVGIAILLTLLFGPIGLFYTTISGAILLLIIPVFLGLLFFAGLFSESNNLLMFSSGLMIVFGLLYWVFNIIMAVAGVKKYNKRLEEEATKQLAIWKA